MKPESYTNARGETVMSHRVFSSLTIYHILSGIRKGKSKVGNVKEVKK